MKFGARQILFGGILAVVVLIVGRWGANYFDTTVPVVFLNGIEESHAYAGDVPCSVDSSRAGEVSMWLDDKPLVTRFKIKAHDASCSFTVPTKTIAEGKHQLRVELVDNSYHRNKVSLERTFTVDNVALKVALLNTDGGFKVFQGRTLHIQLQANKKLRSAVITALSGEYSCPSESKNSLVYEGFVSVECEEKPNEYLFAIDATDDVGNTVRLEHAFQVAAYPFKKHTVTIDPKKLKEEQELGRSGQELEECITEATENSPKEKLWCGAFCTPIDIQRVTCEFGTIRTTQHKGRYAHKALDIINAPKSVVWSTQDGVVVLKERFENSGNTVIIDHGLGLLSLFYHLDSFANIEVGQKIAKGNPVGTIGKTGEATGYHLHWEMRLANVAVDPMQWTRMVL